jgi:DNA-binding transcriptional LysR family regulator
MGEDLIEAFEKKELDVLILPETDKQYGRPLQAEKRFLMEEELWLVGSGKETDMPNQANLADIRRYPFIGFNSEYPGFNVALENALKNQGIQLPSTFSSQNVGTLKRVIEAGLGWGFLPSLSIKKQVRMGRMTRVLLKDFEYKLEFFYYQRKGENTPLMDVFFQALQQQDRS